MLVLPGSFGRGIEGRAVFRGLCAPRFCMVTNRILKSLDEDREMCTEQQAEVDAAWRAEFRRRIDDIESGRVQLIDYEEHKRRVRTALEESRRRRGLSV